MTTPPADGVTPSSQPFISPYISVLPSDLPDDPDTAPSLDLSTIMVSVFRTRFAKLPDQTCAVSVWLDAIRTGKADERVAQVRASRDDRTAYDRLKETLSCVSFAGTFDQGRKKGDPFESSGLIFMELDHHDTDAPEGWLWAEKQRLASHPGVASVYVSCGGGGLHIIAATTPKATNPSEYRQAWGWLSRELGLLEGGDPAVKHPGRLAAISVDPDMLRQHQPGSRSGGNRTPTPAMAPNTPRPICQRRLAWSLNSTAWPPGRAGRTRIARLVYGCPALCTVVTMRTPVTSGGPLGK